MPLGAVADALRHLDNGMLVNFQTPTGDMICVCPPSKVDYWQDFITNELKLNINVKAEKAKAKLHAAPKPREEKGSFDA